MKKILLLSVLTLFFSCRKKENSHTVNSYTPPAAANSAPQDPPVTIGANTQCRGFLGCTRIHMWNDNTPVTTYAFAYFTPCMAYYPTKAPGKLVTKVELNTVPFRYSGYYYEDSLNTDFQSPLSWNITGKDSIPSFSFLNTKPFPSCPSFFSVPDTIHRNQYYTVSLGRLQNSEITYLVLTDGTNSTGVYADTTDDRVTLTIDMLQKVKATSTAELWLVCTNNNVQKVLGQPFCCSTNALYRKKVIIVD